MISFLSGTLAEKSAPLLVIDVNGVGYEVQASLATFAMLPSIGEPVRLLTHFVVREDAQLLFGFAVEDERRLFRALIKVNGVGPKLALAILSGMDSDAFAQCILEQDIKSLVRLPGVGKKTAERLVVEMKDRMAEWSAQSSAQNVAQGAGRVDQNSLISDAENALVTLGYSPTEASKAISKLDVGQFEQAEDLIRAALQTMLNR